VKILVCGDREWTDRAAILAVLRDLTHPGDIVIHGACRGADLLAKSCSIELGLVERGYPAKWTAYGLAAGPIRNQEMLDKEHPDLVVAFHPDLTKSKGTKDMILRAKEAGVPVRWFSRKGLDQ